ncbi:TPA: hypothetical protein ACGW13_000022 [Stenotrophomonas maltophilia]|uniref:hypothetical protein n=1 Tax=Stenotrophomonas maltophilia TaxID=40324 RepID=UPI000B4E3E83|nr:hypothetical protein [Stenotrophomonas maltophilia]MBA0276100.1 hypothetical protein [Stenotrophomonas maltophilia]MBA0315217.1 hypothetical protein [Stenotrophomonas maltophilia]MBA0411299.1 hypothetical protein [Stenotrophomonas maltophilia]MBA0496402.1 hypothetical protein [Stenotrophomonas maltophilia]MBA0500604.1 hypothetical protein [Stenotrophomonas maltophilia]
MTLIRRAASWWSARHAQAVYSASLQRALDERLREIAQERERTDGLLQVRNKRQGWIHRSWTGTEVLRLVLLTILGSALLFAIAMLAIPFHVMFGK